MQPRNNSRHPRRRTDYVSSYANYLNDERNAVRIQQQQRQQLLRRIRRLARVAVIATKTNATSKQRRILGYKRSVVHGLRQLQTNQYRVVAGLFLVVFAVSSFIPPLIQANDTKPITLDSRIKSLVGDTRDDAKDYLKYDANTKAHNFEAPKQDETASYRHTGRNADAYSASFPSKASDGISVTENKSNITVTLVPEFFATAAKKSTAEHVVYKSGARQIIYTLKYNGLKEDIIIPKFQGPTAKFDFKLMLPSGVEARLDDDGNIGIYSSDPTLFGNISYGSDVDRATVDKARENGQKNNLVMTIPYPVVKDSDGKEFTDRAEFVLGKKTTETKQQKDQNLPADAPPSISTINIYDLSLNASKLTDLAYPISVDPTMSVTSSADFAKVDTENNVERDNTNNLIKRGTLTGGVLDTWSTGNAMPQNVWLHKLVFYKDFLYRIGGHNGAGVSLNTVQYAKVVAGGGLSSNAGCGSTWCNTSALVEYISSFGAVAHNGYIYIFAGHDAEGNDSNMIERAKVNVDGSLTAWSVIGTTPTAQFSSEAVLLNGYVYLGPGRGNTATDTVFRAKLNGDGSLGTWLDTGAAPGSAQYSYGFTSDGMNLYFVAGYSSSSTRLSDVYFAGAANDGSLTWAQTTSTPVAIEGHINVIKNGYIYLAGGCISTGVANCNGFQNASYFAPINANGSLGAWRQTTSFTNARFHSSATINPDTGYIYIAGGCSAQVSFLTCSTTRNDIQHVQIKQTPGFSSDWSTTSSHGDPRSYSATAVYRNRIYVVGGCVDQTGTSGSSTNCNTAETSIERGSINIATGAITWSGTTTLGLPIALWGHKVATWSGRLYVTGGCIVGLLGNCSLSSSTYDIEIPNDGNIDGAWNANIGAITARMNHGFEIYNGYAYVVGGYGGSGGMTSVEYVELAPDYTIPAGSWAGGTSLPANRGFIDVVAHNGFLYTAGGSSGTGGGTYNTIIYASIDSSNGSLGSWTTNSVNLTAGVFEATLFTSNGNLYIFPRGTTDKQYGLINSNGSVTNPGGSGSTIMVLSDMPTSHSTGETVVFTNGYVYAVGGCTSGGGSNGTDCNTAVDTVNFASINNGGQGGVGAWTTQANTMTGNRLRHGSLVAGNKLWVFGGLDAAAIAVDTTEYATINTDGTISSFTPGPNLLTTRGSMATAVTNGFVYLMGGEDATSTRLSSVEYAAINSDGSLSTNTCGTSVTWCYTTSSLPAACYLTSADAYNGYIYMTSGSCNTNSKVYIAHPATSGDILSWQVSANLPEAKIWSGATTINNGYIYVLGGCSTGSCIDANTVNLQRTVLSAQINSDGTLGTWSHTTSFNKGRRATAATAYNGFMYLWSGDGGDPSGIQYAPILSGGKLGAWNHTTLLPSQRFSHTAEIHNGTVYLTGGGGGNGSSVVSAPINSIQRAGAFTKQYDFDTGIKPTKLITRGTKQGGARVRVDYSSSNNLSYNLDNAQTIPDTGYGGNNLQTLTLGSNRTLSRYLSLRYTIDDSRSSIFPDAGTESTITDFDLYLTASPGSRLKGGRTFTNGVDRGLDAAPQ